MATRERREHDYSRSNDPLSDLVTAWILALVVLAAITNLTVGSRLIQLYRGRR